MTVMLTFANHLLSPHFHIFTDSRQLGFDIFFFFEGQQEALLCNAERYKGTKNKCENVNVSVAQGKIPLHLF